MSRKQRRGGFLASSAGVKKLKEAKRIKKYSYQKIADEAHVTLYQVNRLFNPQWGNGQYKIGEEAVEAIARVLDLHPTDIVDANEWSPPVECNQQDAVCRFLNEIENNFKYDKLLHIPEQPIILKDQYIPIQVTLERRYTHAVETTWGYAESEAELMRELRKTIDEYLRSGNASTDFDNLNASQLITELSEQDGILQKLHKDSDQYLFMHRTFQEYLTACYLKRVRDGIALAREHFWEYNGHETLSLLAGLMDNPVPLLQAITAQKDDIFSTLLLLAGRCIAECQEISHPLISEIIDRIYKFWQSYPNAGFIESIVVALGQAHSPMSQRLQEALNHSDSDVRFQAAIALGEVGNPQAVDALIAALNHSDSGVRWQAAEALGKIGSPQAINALSAAFNNSDSTGISHVASALGNIGNPQAMDALISALNDSNSEVRKFAVWALGNIGNPQATDALISALKDSSSEVRSRAAFALGRICNPQAVDALISALNDVDYHVRTEAAWTLSTIGNSQAVDALIASLKHPDFYLRVQAALALTEMNYLEGLKVLNFALNQSVDYPLRVDVIWTLGMMRSPQAVNVLIAALKHSDGLVRKNAAEALGRKGNPQGIEILIAVLNYSEGRRTQEILDLSNINNPQAVEALIAALNHSDSDVRWDVAEVLAKRGNPQGVNFLSAALDHLDSKVRGKAAWILAEIGNAQGEDVLIDIIALNDSDSCSTEGVAKVLGKISTSETLAKLIQLPEIDIYDPAIFSLVRTLAIRFSKEKVSFIPVYSELVAHKQ